MAGLRIELSEEDMEKLKVLAAERDTNPEDLVVSTIRQLLDQPDKELEEELDYLLRKHHDLLQRLA